MKIERQFGEPIAAVHAPVWWRVSVVEGESGVTKKKKKRRNDFETKGTAVNLTHFSLELPSLRRVSPLPPPGPAPLPASALHLVPFFFCCCCCFLNISSCSISLMKTCTCREPPKGVNSALMTWRHRGVLRDADGASKLSTPLTSESEQLGEQSKNSLRGY